MNRKGSVLILFVPIILGIFLWSLFLSRWSRGIYVHEKSRIVSEEVLVSALRVKIEGLNKLVAKWTLLQPYIQESSLDGAVVPSNYWPVVTQLSKEAKNSISGYKGRIKSVATVVIQANGIEKDAVMSLGGSALDLGVTAQSQWITDGLGAKKWIEGFWLQRTWSPNNRLGQPDGLGSYEANFSDEVFGDQPGISQAVIRWDVSERDPVVQTFGNGGIPRNWNETMEGNQYQPFRYPYYRADLQ